MDFDVYFPTPLAEVNDPTNDNVDVCIQMRDGKTYTFVFITPDNLKSLMASNHENYIHPAFRFIVINKIEENSIISALKEIVKDAKLLNEYGNDQTHFTGI